MSSTVEMIAPAPRSSSVHTMPRRQRPPRRGVWNVATPGVMSWSDGTEAVSGMPTTSKSRVFSCSSNGASPTRSMAIETRS